MTTMRWQYAITALEAKRVLSRAVLTATVGVTTAACTPPFSELQSARLVGVGHREMTVGYNTVSAGYAGDNAHVQNEVSAQAAFGVAANADIRARYDHITTPDGAFHALSAGPKFGLVRDAVSLYLPVGIGWGGEVESARTLVLNPTLLATGRFDQHAELTGSMKYYWWMHNTNEPKLFAWNLGLGLSSDLDRWALRPEVGLLRDVKNSGHNAQFSLGLTIRR